MVSAIDRATKHYAGIGTLSFPVPEWADEKNEPLTVYFTAMSAADYRATLPNPTHPTHENLVDVVIRKAMDDKGEKLFTLADKPKLMGHVDHAIISRIASAIISKASTVREALGN